MAYVKAEGAPSARSVLGPVKSAAMMTTGAFTVAALYYGQDLLEPLVLAGLLAFMLAPIVGFLERIHTPRVLAVLLATALAFAIMGLLSAIVAQQIGSLISEAPHYRDNIIAKWQALISNNPTLAPWAEPLTRSFNFQQEETLSLAQRFAKPVLSPLLTAAVMLVFALVFLLDTENLRDRFVRLLGRRDLHRAILAMNDAARRLSRYFLSLLALNTAFGIWAGLVAMWLGLPAPILLGLIAGLLRFVPFLGVTAVLVLLTALAFAVAPGWTTAVEIAAILIVSETIAGQVIEPLVYGHGTGLSPVAVLVATSFWALIWGVVGVLIATPVTVCLVTLGRHVDALGFLDILLGSESPLHPSETFYQRALEGRSLALAKSAAAQIGKSSLPDYFDKVALPGLSLALRDSRTHDDDEEAEDRLEEIGEQAASLLEKLAPEALSTTGKVLCLPARGSLDALGATMAAMALTTAGFPARDLVNTALDSPGGVKALEGVSICCLSAFEATVTAPSIRYFVQLIATKAPQASTVICLWGADANSAGLSELRAEAGCELIVLSMGELVAYVRATETKAQPGGASARSVPVPRRETLPYASPR